MRRIGRFSILLLLVILLILGYWYYKKEHQDQALTFFGNVDIREVSLGFRVPGRIEKMMFEEGVHVRTGQVLAQLDQDVFLEDLAMAKAQLQEAEAAFENAALVYKRRSRLIKTGAVSQALFEQAEAQYAQTQAQVKTAKVRIDKAKTALSDTYIKAPRSGYILTRVREPGAIVNAGEIVYTLTVDNPIWVRAFIDEPQFGHIHPGQEVHVFSDTFPNKVYKGHIGYIASKAEFTPKTVETTQLRTDLVFRFRIVVDNPNNELRQGMPVTVKIPFKQGDHNG